VVRRSAAHRAEQNENPTDTTTDTVPPVLISGTGHGVAVSPAAARVVQPAKQTYPDAPFSLRWPLHFLFFFRAGGEDKYCRLTFAGHRIGG